jgi:hypothetical protein
MSVMDSQYPFRTAICTDYEKLLFACQKALETFHHQQRLASLSCTDSDSSGELIRLEAAYARAYARLESHDENCQLCRFVSALAQRNFSSSSVSGVEKKTFV